MLGWKRLSFFNCYVNSEKRSRPKKIATDLFLGILGNRVYSYLTETLHFRIEVY
jgi:hypothetical protein